MITIRAYSPDDWPALWTILQPVFRMGETYAFDPEITEEEACHIWIAIPQQTYVAVEDSGDIVGTYYIKPNQPALGAHVCNCGHLVGEAACGKGTASAMCAHAQREARDRGFLAMQYNLAASTNEAAIHIWIKHGFEIIGTLPAAFRHRRLGLVDAHVMYKPLI